MLHLDTLDFDKAMEEFRRGYLLYALGRELNIKEAKGVKCARVYYDEMDEMLFLEIYDKTGYMNYELNLEYTREDEENQDKEKTGIPVVEGPDVDVYTNVYRYDFYDARGAIAKASPGAQEVVVQENQYRWHFKKIPVCQYDIYMKDPIWLYDTVTGMEGRFYELGYKLTEVTHKHVDGIIAGSRHMYYDRQGVFLKRVYMCGTPWGGAMVYDDEIWDYNFRENTATMKEISVRQDAILRLYKYKMDEQGKLRERMDYIRPRKEMALDTADQATENLVHSRTLHYAYGQNGMLREIKPVFCGPTMLFERIVYEYDAQGRLIAQRDYNDNNEMLGEETYRFIDDRKVEVTCRIFMRSVTDRDGFKEQT